MQILSEHEITGIQALNLNWQLRFCTFSIQIHVVNFVPRANLTRTYEENKCMLYIWITEGYYYEIRGEKTHGRDKLSVRGGGRRL